MRCWPPSRCLRVCQLQRWLLAKPERPTLAFSRPRLSPSIMPNWPHVCASIKRSWQQGWNGPQRSYRPNSRLNTMRRLLAVDPQRPAPAVLNAALAVLRRGGVVAYPTDTVYGLAVDARRPDAIARLYTVKGRPESKALPVIIGALPQLAAVVATVPALAECLMAAFWPGPLTLLLPPHPCVPAALLGDSDRIGVRWPASTLSQQLALSLCAAITTSRG